MFIVFSLLWSSLKCPALFPCVELKQALVVMLGISDSGFGYPVSLFAGVVVHLSDPSFPAGFNQALVVVPPAP